MRSRKPAAAWLIEKEWRELLASRSWWALLLAMGPLVGLSFVAATRTYAEMSGANGAAEALSPLIGVWAPTFSACEIAAVFLLPFVAIRAVGADLQNGASKLELQQGISPLALIGAKALVVMAGWVIALLAPLSAVALWASNGGPVYWPELASVVCGHLLNAALTIALGVAAAAVAEHPSTAAILTLGATVGTWVVNFFGAIQGGWWERAAGYTPAAMVADFQHGLVRLDSTLVGLVLAAAGLGVAAVAMRTGLAIRRRALLASAVVIAAACGIAAAARVGASWDVSENRMNSFSIADERALRRISGPLSVEVHLAAEDPRRAELEHKGLSKLRRLLPDLRVRYVAETATGMFEQSRPGYGEIWYEAGGKKTMSRASTEEGVLEAVYGVTGIAPPAHDEGPAFRGRPVAVAPSGARMLFFGVWPAVALAGAFLVRRLLA